MSDTQRDPQQRARELTGHGFGCGTRIAGSSTDDRPCAECADIAAALQAEYERGQRETAAKCAEIAQAERLTGPVTTYDEAVMQRAADLGSEGVYLAAKLACEDTARSIADKIRAAFGLDETTGEAVSR